MKRAESGNPIVQVRNVSHKYGSDWAVEDLAFNIDGAGIVGMLGSNGAGKSTCMNIMCGVLFPTRGDVLIAGQSIRERPLAAKGRIGFLPQQVPVYPDLTIDEYLQYCAELRALEKPDIRPAVEAAKHRCGIDHLSDRLIGALSGGYRQRVGIAQAILHRPSLVVLDEPTNGLDPNQILVVRRLIREIAEDCTVLLSTHVLSEVEVLCDDIKMIESGRIVFEGTLERFAGVVESASLIAVFGSPPDRRDILALPPVEDVEFLTATKARLHFSIGVSAAEVLVCASAEADWRLHELYFERSSLEDVFARLSSRRDD